MKRKILPGLFFLLALSSVCFAQGVTITSRKVTYKRPKPSMDFKKSFTVNYPKVKAATPALARKIETTISYARVSNLNVQEEINEIQWLEEADFIVNYNKNGILDITLSLSGAGAYPSTFNKTVVVDLKTGNRLRPADVFTNLAGLAAKLKKMQQAEIKKAREDYKKNPDAADFDGSPYLDEADFTSKNLEEFSVSDRGVTFIYEYGFPHVALALQPDGRFFLDWTELKPYIKPGGLLARFIR
jgi:hypothetical protein